MGDTRAGWCVRPNALLGGREAAVQDDVMWVLEHAPGSDYPSFKAFWQAHNLSLFHRCLKPRESHSEFYQLLWGHLLSCFCLSRAETRSKALFFLYTLYATQTKSPAVKIPVDLKTWESLVAYGRKTGGEEAAMIQYLIDNNAFSLGVFVGLKTICPETPELCEVKPRKEISLEDCDFVSGLLDAQELESKSREYHYAKQRAVAGIKAHPEWFPLCTAPKTQIQECLDSPDPLPLTLSNPLFYLDLKVAIDPVLPTTE